MTVTTLLALAGFALASSITPGPNNLMLMASGANFGLRRTIPHMLGISLGHGFLVLCCGLGLAAVLARYPALGVAFKIGATAYMLWLAWKIANAGNMGQAAARAKPFTFLQAAGFQWVNPKGWSMAIGAASIYGDGTAIGAILVAVVFTCCNFPSVSIWAILGTQVARVLGTPRRMRVFNLTMAGLLVLSLGLILA